MDFLPKTLLDTSLELMSVNEEGVRSKTLGLGEETLIGAGNNGNLGRASFFGPFLARPFNLASLNEIGGAGDEEEIRFLSSREFVARS